MKVNIHSNVWEVSPRRIKIERMYNFFQTATRKSLPSTRLQTLSPMVSSRNVSVLSFTVNLWYIWVHFVYVVRQKSKFFFFFPHMFMFNYFSCVPTLCDPMDCSPPGSSVREILQARILEWVAPPSSRVSSQPRDWTCISCITGGFFTAESPGKYPLLFAFGYLNCPSTICWKDYPFRTEFSFHFY